MFYRNFVNFVVWFFIFLFFLMFFIFGVSYGDSENVFDFKINFVNNLDFDFFVEIEIENLVGKNLDFNVEVVYDRKDLVVYDEKLKCEGKCKFKLPIKKVFFGDYQILVQTKYNKNFYQKRLNFNLKKNDFENKILIDKIFYVRNLSKPLNVFGEIFLEKESLVEVQVFSKKNSDFKYKKKFNCLRVCNFSFNLNSTIFFGEYNVVVYLPDDMIVNNFFVKKEEEKNLKNESFTDFNNSFFFDDLNFKDKNSDKDFKVLRVDKDAKKIVALDIFSNKRIVLNKSFNSTVKVPQGFNKIVVDDKRESQIRIKPKFKSVFNNVDVLKISNNLDLEDKVVFNKDLDKIDGLSDFDLSVFNDSKSNLSDVFLDFTTENLSFENNSFSNFSNVSNLSLDFNVEESYEDKSFFNNLNYSNFNVDIKKQEEKIFFGQSNNYIQINSQEDFNYFNLSKKKLVPGIYRDEKKIFYKNLSVKVENNYFAYGLISINTKKPLYKKGELVEFLIVVLDKYGYLVDDAKIELFLKNSNSNVSYFFSSENFDIVKTDKKGVFSATFIPKFNGRYDIFANVVLDQIEVETSSFFNVLDSFDFDIIRDVESTIDPWQGPFENFFYIKPFFNLSSNFDFTEVFSDDFEVLDSNCDEIIVDDKRELKFLIWRNISFKDEIFYKAQVPKKSPFLYFLGNSFIDYSFKGEDKRFYENRSWAFAIDPQALSCDFTSPCICGANCAGGHENLGDGTVDSCSDGNVDYEFINDIRVRSLNGTYFGAGDSVEFCLDFQCDSSSDGNRVSFGYRSGQKSSWTNSDVFYEMQCDNNNLNTVCQNVVLDDFVGEHFFRGKLVWSYSQRPSNDICDEPTYFDHDDVTIEVLEKKPASFNFWNLDNFSSVGNNLSVIRGEKIKVFANWDKPIKSARIRHNANSSFVFYELNQIFNNFTNYTFDTIDSKIFNRRGRVVVDLIQSYDEFFNLEGNSLGNLSFDIFSKVRVNQSQIFSNVGQSGLKTTRVCQFVDENVDVVYENLNVSFFKDLVFLGSSLTDNRGFANFSFVEDEVGVYNFSCCVLEDSNDFIFDSNFNCDFREVVVKDSNSDFQAPMIHNVLVSPKVFSVGGMVEILVNVSDNVLVDSVKVFIIKPNDEVVELNLSYVGEDIFKVNFSDTTLMGEYRFYVKALDDSFNPSYSNFLFFDVLGVKTFIGIESTKSVFKLGDNLDLIDFKRVFLLNDSKFIQRGDVDNIFYDFDLNFGNWSHGGVNDFWEFGNPSTLDLNGCFGGEVGNCWNLNLDGNYASNSNNWIESLEFDMRGREDIVVDFWREINFESGLNDRIYFESFDSNKWNILYQNTINAHDLEGDFLRYYPSEIEGVKNAKFRFRMTSNSQRNAEGFTFDNFNLSFSPRVDWSSEWIFFNKSFGESVNKISAIKIQVEILDFNISKSLFDKTKIPALQIQLFNGTDFSGDFLCELDNQNDLPFVCEIVVKNVDEFLIPWRDKNLRKVRVRSINLDNLDFIEFRNFKKEYVLPSIIENNGDGSMSAFLLAEFRNFQGELVRRLHFAPILLESKQSRNLSDFWSFKIEGDFQLGDYLAYVALTDSQENVLVNQDDNSFINDSYKFTILSLILNPITPKHLSVVNESFRVLLNLDQSYLSSGGFCSFSLDGGENVSLNRLDEDNFFYDFFNLSDRSSSIVFYCNDSDGDFVNTQRIDFNISEKPRVEFLEPTDKNNSLIDRNWTFINVSILDNSFNSSYLLLNGKKFDMNCSFLKENFLNCFINYSRIFRGDYEFLVCANDSFLNVGCTKKRVIRRKLETNLTVWDLSDSQRVFANFSHIFANYSLNNLPVKKGVCEFFYEKQENVFEKLADFNFNSDLNLFEVVANSGVLKGQSSFLRVGNFSYLVNCTDSLADNLSFRKNIFVDSYDTDFNAFFDDNISEYEDVVFFVNYTSLFRNVTGFDFDSNVISPLIFELKNLDDFNLTYSLVKTDIDSDGVLDEFVVGAYSKILGFGSNHSLIFEDDFSLNDGILNMFSLDFDADGFFDDIVFADGITDEEICSGDNFLKIYDTFNQSLIQVLDSTNYCNARLVNVGDFDFDNVVDDIVVSDYRGGFKVFVKENNSVFWSEKFSFDPQKTSLVKILEVFDVNFDGFDDIITKRDSSEVVVFSGLDGSLILNFSLNHPASLSFADFDCDFKEDTFLVGGFGNIYVLGFNGTNYWRNKIRFEKTGYVDKIESFDFNLDGCLNEFVIGFDYWGDNNGSFVKAFDLNQNLLWSYDLLDNEKITSILILDFDFDFEDDVVVGTSFGNLYVLDRMGKLKFKYNIGFGQVGSLSSKNSAISFMDLNFDGVEDLLVLSKEGVLNGFESVSCQARFNDSDKVYDFVFNDSFNLWSFNRSFDRSGLVFYNFSCFKYGYKSQSYFGVLNVSEYIVPRIDVLEPVNSSKFFLFENFSLKVLTNIYALNLSFYLNDNLSKIFSFNRLDDFNWVYNFSCLKTGFYKVNILGNFTYNRSLNQVFEFYVLSNKSVFVSKRIDSNFSSNFSSARVFLKNFEDFSSFVVFDFFNDNYFVLNKSFSNSEQFFVDSDFKGNVLFWKSFVKKNDFEIYFYNLSLVNNSFLRSNYVIGVD